MIFLGAGCGEFGNISRHCVPSCHTLLLFEADGLEACSFADKIDIDSLREE